MGGIGNEVSERREEHPCTFPPQWFGPVDALMSRHRDGDVFRERGHPYCNYRRQSLQSVKREENAHTHTHTHTHMLSHTTADIVHSFDKARHPHTRPM